jgi:hypothetical protein
MNQSLLQKVGKKNALEKEMDKKAVFTFIQPNYS